MPFASNVYGGSQSFEGGGAVAVGAVVVTGFPLPTFTTVFGLTDALGGALTEGAALVDALTAGALADALTLAEGGGTPAIVPEGAVPGRSLNTTSRARK